MRFHAAVLLLFSLAIPIVFSNAIAQPIPDIKVNGGDGPMTITTSQSLSIVVSLNPQGQIGRVSDWWFVASTPSGWFSWNLAANSWSPGIVPVYQGPLISLSPFVVWNTASLPQGNHSYYFGVDLNANGVPDIAQLSYDMVEVRVQGPSSSLVQPGDFQYIGAFRLPGNEDRPRTFAYGGNAMTFNPNGDPPGGSDGFPGSLFITAHDRLPYGEMPDGNQVAEVSIPAPVASSTLTSLNTAQFVQDFRNVAAGQFTTLEELPRVGLEYLNSTATGPKIHVAWGAHFQDPPADAPSHGWFSPNLSSPNFQGTWFIGNQSLYSVNGYLFEIPASWAGANAQNRVLATGRFRDGGWSGMGPCLFAYRPWVDSSGTPAASGTRLPETVLIHYQSSADTEHIQNAMNNYQHPDEWEGGAWLTTKGGKQAVVFTGTKGTGAKYWYGWVHPAGPQLPCVETAFVNDFTVCRLANGSPCPPADMQGCQGHNDARGWWSSNFDAQIIFYNPDDLAAVASGAMNPWDPQPYASLDIDQHLFFSPPPWDETWLGAGVQRRYRIGAAAYDRANSILYVLELFVDDAKPVVHVWRVN